MQEFLCKDCKHSFRKFSEFPSWGTGYEYRCRKVFKDHYIEDNPVVGPIKKDAYYEKCHMARGNWTDAKCGQEGKLWEPKNTQKHLLLWMKHE